MACQKLSTSHLNIYFVVMTHRKQQDSGIEGYFDTVCKAEELAGVMSGELDEYQTLGIEKENKDNLTMQVNLSIKLIKRGSLIEEKI
jgi:hypothetical protein